MPNTREKLIELLKEADRYEFEEQKKNGTFSIEAGWKLIADNLIANGVVVSKMETATIATDNPVGDKWIPVTERMPTYDDADQNGALIGNHYIFGVRVVCLDNIEKRPAHYTHWMPLPEPPKGE